MFCLCDCPYVWPKYPLGPDSCCLPAANRFESVQLPFELRVLETSLKDVTRLCTGLSKEIEAEANPALEALTRKVSCWCEGLQPWPSACTDLCRPCALAVYHVGIQLPGHTGTWKDHQCLGWTCHRSALSCRPVGKCKFGMRQSGHQLLLGRFTQHQSLFALTPICHNPPCTLSPCPSRHGSAFGRRFRLTGSRSPCMTCWPDPCIPALYMLPSVQSPSRELEITVWACLMHSNLRSRFPDIGNDHTKGFVHLNCVPTFHPRSPAPSQRHAMAVATGCHHKPGAREACQALPPAPEHTLETKGRHLCELPSRLLE